MREGGRDGGRKVRERDGEGGRERGREKERERGREKGREMLCTYIFCCNIIIAKCPILLIRFLNYRGIPADRSLFLAAVTRLLNLQRPSCVCVH